MKNYIYLLFAAMLIVFTGCESDDDTSLEQLPNLTLRIKTIVVEYLNPAETVTRNYVYEASGRLKNIQTTSSDGSNSRQDFLYTNDRLTGVGGTSGLQTTYQYTDGKISSATYSDDPNRVTWYGYDNAGRLVVEEDYVEDELISRNSYQYNTNNNVVSELLEFGNLELAWTYTYDTAKNIVEDSYPEPLYALWVRSTNNTTARLTAGGGEEVTFEYQYNASNYPLSCNVLIDGVLERTITYTYETVQ